MLIILTIFLFLFASLAMLILHWVRPRFSIQGLLAVLALLAGIVMVFMSRSEIPTTVSLLNWEPKSLFPVSPILVVDDISWYFALAISALSFGVLISSISNLGQATRQNQPVTQPAVAAREDDHPTARVGSNVSGTHDQASQMPGWKLWIVILIFTSMGLVAVTSGNLLSLVIAWAAIDMLQLVVLLSQTLSSQMRERVIINFSARLVALVLVIIAGMMLWSQGRGVTFDGLPSTVSLLLIFAAGIKLGVLPPLLPFSYHLSMRWELETVLQLIPASASLILLVRVANAGSIGAIAPLLLGFTALVGLYASIKWITASTELDGRLYWTMGIASLAISAAILSQPSASLAWSIACLLSGGLLYCLNIRHRNLIILVILGLFNLSCMPFSPTWPGVSIYQAFITQFGVVLAVVFTIALILVQALIFAGYLRHSLRGISPADIGPNEHVERWVWVLYPAGLLLIAAVHLLIGVLILPDLATLPISAWLIGPLNLLVAAASIYLLRRIPVSNVRVTPRWNNSFWSKAFSLEWLYLLIWRFFHAFRRFFGLVSSILEGDGGLLWALVLFALIFVFLQK